MEILKRGQKPETRKYTASCRNCGTQVRFEKREAEYVSDQRDGDALKVKCPECRDEIWTAVR